jgi:CDP-diacylglycerol--glycerol-3-phosphate 3-phosphatidyltransferase
MIMSVMLIINLDFALINFLEQVAIYLAAALTVISLVDYMIKNKNVLKEKH